MVLEQDGRSERSFDLYSRMMRDRIVFVTGEVEDNMANLISAQILYLESVDPEKDITLMVNSPGGSVTAGMAIFDTMNFVKCDISTICMGQACSMGAFLLAAGTKGKRIALANSRVMIHQPSSGMGRSSVTDMEISLAEVRKMKQNLTQHLANNCGTDYDTMYALCERDHFMSATEARSLGLVDNVVVSRADI
jgi:ATP-dependent Clp protease protease subunit